ncbi:MAG: cardiolipin synthase [Sandaracinaceae bacterium]|nr:cardiolipin synthase [Sandaracinaceae bacterium]
MPEPSWMVIVEVAWVLLVAGFMVLQRRSAPATLAWILTLAFLPLVGIAVYSLIGPRRFDHEKKHRIAAIAKVRRSSAVTETDELVAPSQLARMLARAVGRAGRIRSGQVRAFFDGRALFDALEEAIAGAQHHIHLEYYIWEPDRLGTRLRDRLVERARAGVEVRVLVDAVGSWNARRSFWRPLREAGAEVRCFNENTLFRIRTHMLNFRSHRKIAVIDGEIGFTGGMNVSEVHTSEFSGERAWRDTHAELRGEVVRGLSFVFFEDWHYAGGDAPELAAYFSDRSPVHAEKPSAIQIVSSGPDEGVDAIHKLFISSITGATSRVQLTTPYFVPDEPILTALTIASLGGVDVSLLVPRAGDQPLVAAAARTYYPDLLKAGAKIYELDHPVLHAKTLVVDDVAVVGTANTDNRSFRLNFEVVAVVYDHRLADTLAKQFEADLATAEPVALESLRRLGLLERLIGSVARLFSPLL